MALCTVHHHSSHSERFPCDQHIAFEIPRSMLLLLFPLQVLYAFYCILARYKAARARSPAAQFPPLPAAAAAVGNSGGAGGRARPAPFRGSLNRTGPAQSSAPRAAAAVRLLPGSLPPAGPRGEHRRQRAVAGRSPPPPPPRPPARPGSVAAGPEGARRRWCSPGWP